MLDFNFSDPEGHFKFLNIDILESETAKEG